LTQPLIDESATMQSMASTPTATRPDAEHDAEVAKQAEIEAAVAPEAPVPVSPSEVVEEQELITLRSVSVDEYPLTVTVVGSEPLEFANEGVTVEVPPEVAEQLAYSPVVEVAE
jgi:hypothetical protein